MFHDGGSLSDLSGVYQCAMARVVCMSRPVIWPGAPVTLAR
ncbi:hypothetical protein ALQ59_101485 [Pseudomonas syringae pv. apii]|uniref:Uncharacterized protein n=1 Tax=Pseudomonas syringae pv. apii TaxID=81036 RepID=A0A3M3M733_9PSED|nr:hypothetical protein ALQ59_101485 [Pseudomonas syringae pv. apii]RMN51137.1 hypothetical protein ALQ58_101311 [Pseudomonas syringae pv. apii]RMO01608.1 hypothetical protein ALQ49_101096 [Pseudomonas syringae pv. apii]